MNNTKMLEEARAKLLKRDRLWAFWDKFSYVITPKRESISLPRRIKRGGLVLLYQFTAKKHCDFDGAIRRFRPDIEKGSALYRRMYIDAIECMFCYEISHEDFFDGRFYRRNHNGKIKYPPLHPLYTMFNGTTDIEELTNKYLCYQKLEQYFQRQVIEVKSSGDSTEFSAFLAKYGCGIIKPTCSYGGHGIQIITSEMAAQNPKLCEKLLAEIGSFVLEELVVQDERMAYFNASSVNTVRMEMVVRHGKPEPLFCWCRYGKAGSVTDNISNGGGAVMIDPVNGITYSNEFNGVCDPVSGKQVVGIQIPLWPELVELAASVMREFPQYRLLAFDFALSKEKGWVVIEGNALGGFHVSGVDISPAYTMQALEQIAKEG